MSERLLRVLSLKEVIGYVRSRLAQKEQPADGKPKAKTKWL